MVCSLLVYIQLASEKCTGIPEILREKLRVCLQAFQKSDAPPTPTAAEKEKERKRKKPPPPTPTAAEHDEMQAELESEKAELDKLKKMQRDSLRKHGSNKQARPNEEL